MLSLKRPQPCPSLIKHIEKRYDQYKRLKKTGVLPHSICKFSLYNWSDSNTKLMKVVEERFCILLIMLRLNKIPAFHSHQINFLSRILKQVNYRSEMNLCTAGQLLNMINSLPRHIKST